MWGGICLLLWLILVNSGLQKASRRKKKTGIFLNIDECMQESIVVEKLIGPE